MSNDWKINRPSYSPPAQNALRHPFASAPAGSWGTSNAPRANRTEESYEDFLNRIKGDLTYGGVQMTEADWKKEEDYIQSEYADQFRGMDPGEDDVFHEEGSTFYDLEDTRYALECQIPVNQVSDHWAYVGEEMKGEMLQLNEYLEQSQGEMERLVPIIKQARDNSTQADHEVEQCEQEMGDIFTRNGLDVPIEYTTNWNRLRDGSVRKHKRYQAIKQLVGEMEDYQYWAEEKFQALKQAYRYRQGWFYLKAGDKYEEELGDYCEKLLKTSAKVKSTVPTINNNNAV